MMPSLRVNPLSRTSGDGREVRVYCHQGRRIPVPGYATYATRCYQVALLPPSFRIYSNMKVGEDRVKAIRGYVWAHL